MLGGFAAIVIGGLNVDVVMIGVVDNAADDDVNDVVVVVAVLDDGTADDVVMVWVWDLSTHSGRLCTAGGSVRGSAVHPCGGG